MDTFKQIGDQFAKLAEYHFKKALELARDDPARGRMARDWRANAAMYPEGSDARAGAELYAAQCEAAMDNPPQA